PCCVDSTSMQPLEYRGPRAPSDRCFLTRIPNIRGATAAALGVVALAGVACETRSLGGSPPDGGTMLPCGPPLKCAPPPTPFAGDAGRPLALDALAPDVFTPDAFTSDALTPDALTSDALTS